LLKSLKERITARFEVPRAFETLQEFGDQVTERLTGAIEEQFPEGSEPDPLDRLAAEHEAYASSRRRVYVGREEPLDRLDDFVRGEGHPLVIVGESGSGKSALLANWIDRYRGKNPDRFLIEHYVGANADSADWSAMLRRLLGEFKRDAEIDIEIPNKPEALRHAFAEALHAVAQKCGAVIVIDALNQLEDGEGALELVWLPEEVPDQIRLIVSTLPGPSLKELERRGWLDTALRVEPLEETAGYPERSTFIRAYLESNYAKKLSDDRALRIAHAEQCSNPLFLRAMLEELRQFGVHELLDERIDYYLQARDIPELYEKILSRWEIDYEEARPGLVRDSMTLVWASRKGLSEGELLDLLGNDGERLPAAYWSPLSLAGEGSLVNHGGYLSFSHDFIRRAVAHKYLRGEDGENDAHRRLASFFRAHSVGDRELEETPWQYARAGDFEQLEEVLTDPEYFLGLSFRNRYELWDYWHKRPRGSKPPVEVYRASITAWESQLEPERLELALNELTHFFNLTMDQPAQIEMAKRVFKVAESLYGPDDIRLAIRKNNLGHANCLEGNFEEALRLSKEAQPIYEREFDVDVGDRWVVLSNQAHYLLRLGRLEESVDRSRVVYDGCRQNLGRWHDLTITAAGNLAAALQLIGKFDEATPFFEEAFEGHKRVFGLENPWTEKKRQMLEEHLRDFVNATDRSSQMIELGMKREAYGFAALAAESYGRALIFLDEEHAAATDAGRVLAARNLAAIECDLGNYEAAQRAAKHLLAADRNIFRGRFPKEYAARLRLAAYFALHGRLDLAAHLVGRWRNVGRPSVPNAMASATIRSTALVMYQNGRYQEARQGLERLVQRGWELASTHCHLARIGLVTDDLDFAKQHAALAWEHRTGAEQFNTLRILWIKLAIALLEGDSRAMSTSIGKLKTALENHEAFQPWLMDPVLGHLSLKLPSETHDLLTALAAAIQGTTPLTDLERFHDWAEAEPIPIESE
jgi:nephrocystin-3